MSGRYSHSVDEYITTDTSCGATVPEDIDDLIDWVFGVGTLNRRLNKSLNQDLTIIVNIPGKIM